MVEKNKDIKAGPEQILYASILEKGMLIGLFILFITFFIYVFGIMKPYIPLDEISKFWSMNVHDYLEHAKIKGGWSWLLMLGYGDFINFIGIAILAGVTIICYIGIIPHLARQRDWAFVVFLVMEVLVLSLAASGLLKVGH
ncbi:MAG TPA: hypothetical protein ENF54_00265 [Desulfobacteraceae bacterium]|nr:hypothetical protein [Desulfobacteraceae bacterium]